MWTTSFLLLFLGVFLQQRHSATYRPCIYTAVFSFNNAFFDTIGKPFYAEKHTEALDFIQRCRITWVPADWTSVTIQILR